MRLTRILSTILAFVMVIGCFTALPASAATLQEGGTVYVSAGGNNSNDGLTEEAPVADIATATKIIAAANVKAATVKLIGTVTDKTETAHPNTVITYTGNDTNALFKPSGSFTIQGPVIFKDLKLEGVSGGRYIYTGSNTLIMDTGLSMTSNIRIAPAYSGDFDSFNVTIKSGTYNHIYTNTLAGGKIKGDVNLTVIGEKTKVSTIVVGGNFTANANNETVGETNVTLDNGIFTNVVIGSCSTGTTTFKKAVNVKINGGTFSGNIRFGAYENTYSNTVFENGCLIDFSGFDPTRGEVETWRTMLNQKSSEGEYENAFTVTDCAVAGAQPSLDKTAARFVIGIRDYENKKASVKIIARDADNNVIKTFETPIYEVYTSVLANKSGSPEAITAKEMGANYIMAVTIKNIPTSGVASFEVIPTFDGVVAPATTFAYPLS